MIYDLNHSEGNPRNSEGSFITLKDGRIRFIYSRYNGDHWGDDCTADLAEIISCDNGRSWSEPRIVVKNRFKNVMSVSLLRLHSGRIIMSYLEKKPLDEVDACGCRPLVCFSDDEGESWSEPADVARIPNHTYLVVNNDRLIQLKNGRLILPASWHRFSFDGKGGAAIISHGFVVFFVSDDDGLTWRESQDCCYPPAHLSSGYQEPGVIELSGNRVWAWARNGSGAQHVAMSYNNGENWGQAVRAREFLSPCAPLSMKRDPKSGDLIAVWCSWDPCFAVKFDYKKSWGRTPLVMARSTDEGKSWVGHVVLEDSPDHGYCYTAIEFLNDGKVLLAYCCGGGENSNVLQDLRIRIADLPAVPEKTEG